MNRISRRLTRGGDRSRRQSAPADGRHTTGRGYSRAFLRGALVLLPLALALSCDDGSPVEPENVPPAVDDSTLTMPKNRAISYDLPATDSDGDPLTYVLEQSPTHGTVVIEQLGAGGSRITYTPEADFVGEDAIGYGVSDGVAEVHGKLTIEVIDRPPATEIPAVVSRPAASGDGSVDIVISASDPDGDPLSIEVVTPPAHGTLTPFVPVEEDVARSMPPGSGSWLDSHARYTPFPGFSGNDSFEVSINSGGSSSRPIKIEIHRNGVPTANPVTASTAAGQAVSVSLSGSDPDGDALTFEIVESPTGGTLGDITLDGDAAAHVLFTPDQDASGTVTFTYRVRDGLDVSPPAEVTVTVAGPPTGTSGSVTLREDKPTPITLLGDDAAGTGLSFAIAAGPEHGTLGDIQAGPRAGEATVLYTPEQDYSGEDGFTFQVTDGNGLTATAAMSLTIEPVNDAPSFDVGPDQVVGDEAGAQTVTGWARNIAAGPPDEAAQMLEFHVTGNTNAALFAAGPVVSTDGTLTYAPKSGAKGTAVITLVLTDKGDVSFGGDDESDPQTFSITVDPVDGAPVAHPGEVDTNEDTPLTITLTGTDPEGADVTFAIGNAPAHGTLGTITDAGSTATVTYTPNANYHGSDAFTFSVAAGTTTSAPATVSIDVVSVNDPPSFTAGGNQHVWEGDAPQSVAWATAIDPGAANESGQTVTFDVTITATNNSNLFSSPPAISGDGTLTYTLAAYQNGTATASVVASDGLATTPASTFTIKVDAVPNPPATQRDTFNTNEDTPVEFTLTGTDPDGDTLVFHFDPPDEGTIDTVGVVTNIDGTNTLKVRYTPLADMNGHDSFYFWLDDGVWPLGSFNLMGAVTTVMVAPVNDAPTFTAGANQTVNEDAGPQTVDDWATAIDPGPADESGQTVNFDVTVTANPGLFSTAPAVASDGTLTYTPAPNANGTATVSVKANDGATSPASTFTITVNPVADPPTAVAATVNTDEDVPLTITLTGTDVDGDDLHFVIASGPDHGSLGAITEDGQTAQVTYAPNVNESGADTLTFTVSDGTTTSSAATVAINVRSTNDRATVTIEGDLLTPPGGPVGTASKSITVTADTILHYLLKDAEALDENDDARAPYFFRIALISWPNDPGTGDPFEWKHFDDQVGFAKDAHILKPNFTTGNGGYIQFSSSIGVSQQALNNLEAHLNRTGTYTVALTIIDNGFQGYCPTGLVTPDPAETATFDSEDYRRSIGREGDHRNGDQTRCIRESTATITLTNNAAGGASSVVTFNMVP